MITGRCPQMHLNQAARDGILEPRYSGGIAYGVSRKTLRW